MPFFFLELKDLFSLAGLCIFHCRFLIVLDVLSFRVSDGFYIQILHLCRYSEKFFVVYYIVYSLLLCLPSILCLKVVFFFGNLPLDSPPSNLIITNFLEVCKSVSVAQNYYVRSNKKVSKLLYTKHKKCQNYYKRSI